MGLRKVKPLTSQDAIRAGFAAITYAAQYDMVGLPHDFDALMPRDRESLLNVAWSIACIAVVLNHRLGDPNYLSDLAARFELHFGIPADRAGEGGAS